MTFHSDPCRLGVLEMPSGMNEGSFDQQSIVSTETKPLEVIENDSKESSDINILGKEKTPMCLVNELARHNKVPHQYRLTDEKGPAHRKLFTVTLKLGEEEYTAEGASIKKAQHQAASIALSKTGYKHPPPKPLRSIRLGKNNITPTVELNAWAMKRGELATYHFISPATPPLGIGPACPTISPVTNLIAPLGATYNLTYNGYRPAFSQIRSHGDFHRRNMYRPQFPPYDGQRFYGKPLTALPPPMFAVMVRVGTREFTGEGATAQMARHAAAAKALADIRQLPLPDEKPCIQIDNGTLSAKEDSEIKSPISLVHEIALRRNMNVKFDVVKVTGPPHMRNFHTICQVGEFTTEGIGNGKKVSKRRASEQMLEELKKLPLEPPCISTATINVKSKRKPTQKKKARNLIKEAKPPSPEEISNNPPIEKEDINPISRLIQIQQAKKEPEPIYSLIEERGAPRRREFIMSVKVGDQSSTGSGPNKKLAKRAAAENILQELGYSRSNKPAQENNRMQESTSVGGSSGRQLVPGLLLMSDVTYSPPLKGTVFPESISAAKDMLQTDSLDSSTSSQVVRPKDQLMYLASLLNFKVQFSDFPKGNHREFLSLVSLSTSPPQVCHGSGQTVETSHDQAALTALRMLGEMGLDMFNKKDSSSHPPSGPATTLDGNPAAFNPGPASSTIQVFDEKQM